MLDLDRFKIFLARVFSSLFLALSVGLIAIALRGIVEAVAEGQEPISLVISAINVLFVGLATFELGVGIGKEYTEASTRAELFDVVRRTITRFVGVVVIALSLEGLVMVIKYSQLDLAGNLYYPVAIIFSAGFLLLSMGGFLMMTRRDSAVKAGV
jgi:hypothetical protein